MCLLPLNKCFHFRCEITGKRVENAAVTSNITKIITGYMKEEITRGNTGQVDEIKNSSAVKDSLGTTRFAIILEVIVSKHVFFPSIGDVGQSKTPEPACARARSDKVHEIITRAITVRTV
jgi:hypothetical protein